MTDQTYLPNLKTSFAHSKNKKDAQKCTILLWVVWDGPQYYVSFPTYSQIFVEICQFVVIAMELQHNLWR